MTKPAFYITTPIYYVNAKPHLGTLYSTIIADVLARFARLAAREVYFLTGTDEHGQKIQEKAQAAGVAPKAFVDQMVPAFKHLWQQFEIDYSAFIRTTDEQHVDAVLYLIKKLEAQGDIYKASYEGWYCVPCETFVNTDEVAPSCPTCSRELVRLSEENYFFRLSAYQDRLLQFYEQHSNFIMPSERLREVISFVESGLQDLSISRKGLAWGIRFPGDNEHAVYVWLDALTNYISALGYGTSNSALFEKFWPANIQVMAKDIVRFHAVYWPAFLMAAGLPLPHKLLVHGYILMGDTKMSKSMGNVVDPEHLAREYGVEQVRYYLMRQIPTTHDGHFSLEDLEARVTADLANSLGNLQSRVITLALASGCASVTSPQTWEAVSEQLRLQCAAAHQTYWDEMSHGRIHLALAAVWKFIAQTNAFVNDHKPWELAKKQNPFFGEVIAASLQSLHAVALMLWPIMPKKMEELLASIGLPFASGSDYDAMLRGNSWHNSFALTRPSAPLFTRVEKKEAISPEPESPSPAKAKASSVVMPELSIDELVKVHLVVGTILSCEPVTGSDKLYRLKVDLGVYGTRQILSGVRKNFSVDDLQNKQGIFVVNLAPRTMLGLTSEGMMLFAKDESGAMVIATVGGMIKNGTRLS